MLFMKKLILALMLSSSFHIYAIGSSECGDLECLYKEVEEGSSLSACTISAGFLFGQAVQPDLEKAVQWAEKSDEMGYKSSTGKEGKGCLSDVFDIIRQLEVFGSYLASLMGKDISTEGASRLLTRAFLENDAHAMCELVTYVKKDSDNADLKNIAYLTRRANEMNHKFGDGRTCAK